MDFLNKCRQTQNIMIVIKNSDINQILVLDNPQRFD